MQTDFTQLLISTYHQVCGLCWIQQACASKDDSNIKRIRTGMQCLSTTWWEHWELHEHFCLFSKIREVSIYILI